MCTLLAVAHLGFDIFGQSWMLPHSYRTAFHGHSSGKVGLAQYFGLVSDLVGVLRKQALSKPQARIPCLYVFKRCQALKLIPLGIPQANWELAARIEGGERGGGVGPPGFRGDQTQDLP